MRKSGFLIETTMTKQGLVKRKLQTYRCIQGHMVTRSYDNSRWSDDFLEHVVFVYLNCLSLNTAIEIIREQYDQEPLTKGLIIDFIEIVAKTLPTLDDIDGIYHPHRSGYIACDGVWFKIAGKEFVLLIAFDPDTFDIVAYHTADDETGIAYEELITRVTNKLGSKTIKGLYADGDSGFLSAWKKLLPMVPFQLCVFHKELRMGQMVPIKSVAISKQMSDERKQELKDFQQLFRNTIYTDSKEKAWEALEKLKQYTKEKQNEKFIVAYNSLKHNFIHTLTHFDYPHMKRDNNMLECFNGIIKPRLKLMRGFKKEENREWYLKLFLLNYRFHALKESRQDERRGKTPLEVAKVTFPKYFNFMKLLRESLQLNYLRKKP